MNLFLFSRRFLIPFFIIMILHIGYVLLGLWNLYKGDFLARSLPAWVVREWLWRQATGKTMATFFLLSLVIGIIYYSHSEIRKKGDSYKPFSPANMIMVLILLLAGFLHTAFYEPKNFEHSVMLLARVIYASSDDEFQQAAIDVSYPKNENTMTLPGLYHARDSLTSKNTTALFSENNSGDMSDRLLKKVKFQIAWKTMYPFVILLFYVLGILLGTSLFRIKRIFSLLIGYFLLFPAWYFGQEIFKRLYNHENAGAFVGANGMTLVFAVLAVVWLFMWKKQFIQIRAAVKESLLNFNKKPA